MAAIPMKLADFGALRLGLFTITIFVIIMSAFADGNTYMHDWRLVPSVLAPSIMMMLVFAIPLEMTMTAIYMSDANANEKSRLKHILKIEAIAYVALIVSWVPFFFKILD